MDEIPLQNLKLQNQIIREELIQAFTKVLDSGNYVSGKEVQNFENNFARFTNSKYALGVSTGSSALEIALKSLNLKKEDEVVVPSLTFIATIEAVLAAGATPVLVDIDEETWNISPEAITETLNKNTKVVMPVHLHGRLADMEQILIIAKENNLFVVEDSAQCHGARRNNLVAGSIGDIAGFSFYPGKNLGAIGEAGAITTNSQDLFEQSKLIRNYGSSEKYVHKIRGNNFRMDEIQGLFLDIKLKRLDEWTEKRIQVAKKYDEILDSMDIIHPLPDTGRHVYHVYSVLVENRDVVMKKMREANIGVSSHYPIACHKQSGYENYIKIGKNLSNSETISSKLLSLPIDESITTKQIEIVCDNLNKIIKSTR